MKRITYIASLLLLFFTASLFAQIDKGTVFDKVKQKYGNMKSVAMQFHQIADEMEIEASIKAKRQNKYVLQVGERKIVCNGKTIWNYSVAENTVIISKFEIFEYEVSIEEFFFSFLDSYVPARLVTQSTSDGRYALVLSLRPQSETKMINGVSFIDVWLDKNNYEIMTIEIDGDMGRQKWEFENIVINPELPDKTFEFSPPKGVKVIDLR